MRRVMASLLALTLVVALVSCGDKSEDIVLKPAYNDFAEAKQVAEQKNLPLLVKFYTETCKWCKKMDTVVLASKQAKDYFTSEMVLAKVNARVDTMLAKEHNVSAFPTLVLLDTTGHEIDRIVGYMDLKPFIETLDNYQKGIGTLGDMLDKWEQVDDPRMAALEIAEKYKYRGKGDQAREWYDKVIEAGDATDSLSGESRMAMADLARRADDFDTAIKDYEQIMVDFKGTMTAENAEIWRAYVFSQKSDTASAIKAYEDFVKNHPKSEEVEWVKGQIAELTGAGKDSK